VVFGRGGIYRGTPLDVQTPFLQTLLGFIGLTDVEYIFAEGLDMGPEAQQAGLVSARAAIASI
jgi:FMN-dependent NADH-azoreductase